MLEASFLTPQFKDEISVEGKFEDEYKIGSEISLRINTDALIELPK